MRKPLRRWHLIALLTSYLVVAVVAIRSAVLDTDNHLLAAANLTLIVAWAFRFGILIGRQSPLDHHDSPTDVPGACSSQTTAARRDWDTNGIVRKLATIGFITAAVGFAMGTIVMAASGAAFPWTALFALVAIELAVWSVE